MAFPTDLADVVAGGAITASRNNAITAKIGIDSSSVVTSLDYLLKSTSSGNPGHLHTTLGTIATGVWNGTAIADEYGGTGQTTYAAGDILYASGVDTLTKLAKGSDTEVLTLASGLPSWAAAGGGSSAFTEAVTIAATDNTNPLLTVTQSGTGDILNLVSSDAETILSIGDQGNYTYKLFPLARGGVWKVTGGDDGQIITATNSGSGSHQNSFGPTNHNGKNNFYGTNLFAGTASIFFNSTGSYGCKIADATIDGKIRSINFSLSVSGATDRGDVGMTTSAGDLIFNVKNTGNVTIGKRSLATDATAGFPYIPSCPGTPTGTPTTITGCLPLVIDDLNNILYFYDGAAWVAVN